MTDTEVFTLVVPGSGEVLDLDNPEDLATAFDRLATLNAQVQTARTLVVEAFVSYRVKQGLAGTFRTGNAEVKISESDTITWDLAVLRELHGAGLPVGRWQELVTETVETKVSATVAKQIAKANPVYAEIIERAQTRTPKRPSVSVAMRHERM